ncbi:MAG: FliA/WhiG family RNA polymerase sigma factor [Candidatus Eisenbacteria bacterium]|nr:FliA/WhiG family RNA polymerase sigma factor [Candidatus Eisenbacteria bacterium]
MPRPAAATLARSTPALRVTGRRPAAKPAPARTPAPGRGAPRLVPPPAPVTYSKEDLLARFAPLVRHVVERVAANLPRNVDHEDLYSAGVLGLLDAHAKFDTGKGVKFETYAVWRIKGAVLDQLRALDWVSRSMRRKARTLDGVTRRLDQKLGRAASEEEVARELRMSRGDFYRLLDHVRGAVLVSLDESRSSEDQESSTLGDHLPDPRAVDQEARLEEEQTRLVLLRTLNLLPEQERLVVALYYYEHLTLKEIGRALGISESRVSQVHTRAMVRLRLRLHRALGGEELAA